MIRVTKPNGVVFHVPRTKLAEVVLELSGGGYSEKSVREAMLNSDKLRSGAEVSINGFKLQLTEE